MSDARAWDNIDLRSAFGCFVTGVTVVCAEHKGIRRGFTANSFASVSLSPPLLSVCLDSGAHSMDVFSVCAHFAVSVLSASQRDLAYKFAHLQGDRFAGVRWRMSPLGSPVIENSLAWFDCRCERRIGLGDHTMLLGHVHDFGTEDSAPLTYFRSSYERWSE